LGEKVRQGNTGRNSTPQVAEEAFDTARAALGIPIVMQLLGYKNNNQ
jgi:hypothetical protein